MKKLLIIITMLVSSHVNGEDVPLSFSQAKELALKVQTTSEFLQFEKGLFGKSFGACGSKIFQYCFSQIKSPNTESFEFVLVIDEVGLFKKLHLSKQTNIAECMRDNFCKSTFPLFKGAGYMYHEKIAFSE